MSIWSASSGPIASCDISIKGGVMLLFGILFVWAHSLQSEMWLAILPLLTALLDGFGYSWVFAILSMMVLNEFVDQLLGK